MNEEEFEEFMAEMGTMSQQDIRAAALSLTMDVVENDEHNLAIEHVLGGMDKVRKQVASYIARALILVTSVHEHHSRHNKDSHECDSLDEESAAVVSMIAEGTMLGLLMDPTEFSLKATEGLELLGKINQPS